MWIKLMKVGSLYGCHQKPGRSFFIKHHQFPVCARCTGVLIGSICAYALFFVCVPSLLLCFLGCAVMFMDWFMQQQGMRESKNIWRFSTGIIGGYSLTSIFCIAVRSIVLLLV